MPFFGLRAFNEEALSDTANQQNLSWVIFPPLNSGLNPSKIGKASSWRYSLS